MMTKFDGYKTYLALALGLLVCGAELAGIDVVPSITAQNALETAYGLIVAGFMRNGIAKAAK
jgi:hypothetical protein